MKKVILFATFACMVTMNSCKSSEQGDASQAESKVVETVASSAVQGAISDVPQFSDPETQKFVDGYAAYMKQSMEIYKTKDMTKIAELQASAMEWSKKSQDFATRIAQNPDDMKKYSEYIQKLSTEMQEAMK